MNKWKQWRFWGKVRNLAESRMKKAWFIGGNCDSCCPRCKQWESAGNRIDTESNDDGSETRTCSNCSHEWKAIFTPAGFLPLNPQ